MTASRSRSRPDAADVVVDPTALANVTTHTVQEALEELDPSGGGPFVQRDGTTPLTGDWDNTGRRFRNTGAVEVSASAPSTPATGLLWLDIASSSGSSGTMPIRTETSNYTAAATDAVILCDATSGPFTVTLPAAASSLGKVFYIKKIDGSGGAVTVDGNASETIDGAVTLTVSSQYDAALLVCDGSNWWIL